MIESPNDGPNNSFHITNIFLIYVIDNISIVLIDIIIMVVITRLLNIISNLIISAYNYVLMTHMCLQSISLMQTTKKKYGRI